MQKGKAKNTIEGQVHTRSEEATPGRTYVPVLVESQVQGSSREEPSGRVAILVALFHV